MRVAGKAGRAVVAAATALLLTAPTVPAWAEPTTIGPAPEPNASQRPPSAQPSAIGGPFRNTEGCIASATTENLPKEPWGQQQLQIEEAQRFATGKGQKVAVIDTGVNQHPLFKNPITDLGDYIEGKSAVDSDCDGHGTEVAGIIAAQADPTGANGFMGVAPDVQLMAIRQGSSKFQNEATKAPPGNLDTLARAVVWAADHDADVINMSVTACQPPDKTGGESDKALRAAIRYAVDVKDVVVVTSAGNTSDQAQANDTNCVQNDNPDPNVVTKVAVPPWFSDDVLAVAAMAKDGTPANFTVWGPWVNIAAPGTEIVSVNPAPGSTGLANANIEGSQQRPIEGTSFASPYVAGVAALVRERFPELNARQVMERLKATAKHPGNPEGRDKKVGYGMVNPIAALTAVLPAEQSSFQSADPKPILNPAVPPPAKDWTPMIVALGGTGAGVTLLLLTLFIVHTVNRTRNRRARANT
ncbi:type VII secretion-associated serine protease mycosin [Goodfellowiella coeruleoviolacea]|uniref:Membrane-anchored mycosin MYCP n=1 Tax=Goodfellowiella coeruleoviolacea TaxID=334858 RepID=A0AAE3GDL7_9PSEU|nr:type VII secretion-associated serine protease mycosin [Goodfellowiella coeruleoviolacea]MCP2165813.1 membrane-anchored mycosin MYCP [Goodfellowiella coeruleoviolacea]